jgi:hypothetical protein
MARARLTLAEFRWGKKHRVVLSDAEKARRAARMAGTLRQKGRSVAGTPLASQETASDGAK